MNLPALDESEGISKTFCAPCLKLVQASSKIVMLEANKNNIMLVRLYYIYSVLLINLLTLLVSVEMFTF